ncbi:antitoxin [Cellulomonas marina]|uniref:Antitoxin n=2 Tax=Cellulomonas marina TaxID=988821 RepID=A0A1I1AFU1_9CELL|nr:antitoxin [Cellulomonas marina]SFB36895.1 prevent-host-death family protein [Cellulomonas marina]
MVHVRSVPLHDAKTKLSAYVAEVRETHERITITRHGEAEAVLISADELDVLEETLELLAGGALSDAEAARRAHDEGRTTSLDDLKAELRAAGKLPPG